jgi:dUTP pyrophosphatase
MLNFNGSAPVYSSEGAAGADLKSNENVTVESGTHEIVSTNTYLEIPKGYEGQVRSRSGLAAKHGVFVLNSPGTIDSDYRGEVKVILMNNGPYDFKVAKGDRIAQIVFAKHETADFVKEHFTESERGDCGFGSTGIK